MSWARIKQVALLKMLIATRFLQSVAHDGQVGFARLIKRIVLSTGDNTLLPRVTASITHARILTPQVVTCCFFDRLARLLYYAYVTLLIHHLYFSLEPVMKFYLLAFVLIYTLLRH